MNTSPRYFFFLSLVLTVGLLSCFSDSSLAQSEQPKPEQPKKIDRISEEWKGERSGFFYGHIVDIDERWYSITVKPIDPKFRRKRFYLDKQTKYFNDTKKTNFSDVYLGDKVAVRFLAEGYIALAEAVYVVPGEFMDESYYVESKGRRGKK